MSRLRAWWDRLVWSQIREARERCVKAEQRVVILERQIKAMRRERRDLRADLERLHAENERLHDLEQFVAALGLEHLPESGGAA